MVLTQKSNLIDCFKLFFAYCVVAIHTQLAGALGDPPLLQLFLGMAVPYFFLCSGYFLQAKIEKVSRQEYRSCIAGYFRRLGLPYLIWGSWYFVLEFVNRVLIDRQNGLAAVKELLLRWVISSPGGGLWYVQAILCLLVILWVLNNKKHTTLVVTIMLTATYLFSKVIGRFSTSTETIKGIYDTLFANDYNALNFLFNGAFFMLGMQLRKVSLAWKSSTALTAGSLAVFVLTGIVYLLDSPLSDLAVISIIRVLSLFIFTLHVHVNLSGAWSKRLRTMSTMIYFLHFTAIYGVKILLKICASQKSVSSLVLFLITAGLLTLGTLVLSGMKGKLLKKLF